ncbi:class I SAM-dependent methyltransferase [Myxococcus sp. K15C18031901]|uniref:class I SAM-dependent methyltransferase n=1 Tax=Myxococcus dinghuensis TaxID=2906761 RepID=UPI0020A82DDD|nr:class I SAM-dependent methyltransferase [Myxococcus dinghuensis]MCP3098105.1 class I SAM-dependent methyltransferase [Myxococcus dinghuensis]
MPLEARLGERVPETDNGQQGEFIAHRYDLMQRHIRDRGWLQEKVDLLVARGLGGVALEVGMGPGYLGLEWLKATRGTSLVGLDISPEMVACAEKNRSEYGLQERATFCLGDAQALPFEDGRFDCVFSYGSLHEWSRPEAVLDEVHRVLKPGGRYCVIDLRRDLDRQALTFMRVNIDVELRAGFMSSVRSSYTLQELRALAGKTALRDAVMSELELGLYLTGTK